MNPYDFKNIGEEIKDAVQRAIDSEDFTQLNQTIKEGVEKAASAVEDGLRATGKAAEKKVQETVEQHPWVQEKRMRETELSIYKKTTGIKAGAISCMVIGYICGFGLGLALLILGMVVAAMGEFLLGLRVPIAVMVPLFFVSLGIGIAGHWNFSMLKRFEKYKSCLNGKTYGNLSELSSEIGKSIKYVQKDIREMIIKGWFRQGHFDDENTCLITTDETYEDYKELKEKIRKQNESRKAVTPEVDEVIREGEAFIDAIHKSNEVIQGEEISSKIASMEEIIKRIFERVQQYPEMIGEIRKLMEYYLPTTIKLLKAYEELEKQPVQGENILSSKKEIEGSLDTLNTAFEKLLDRLFQDQAWDVSSDISVLKTMIAQDGLAEEDF